MTRRGAVPLAAIAVAVLTIASPAARAAARTTHPIRANQFFVGTVNHNNGRHGPAPVRVACAGPVHQGETTHPLAHQPLEVLRVSSGTNTGSTGPHGNRVTAYLGIPPAAPAAAGAPRAPATGLPTFTRYGAPQPIPTSINVPCSGRGYITFMPWPRDPGVARAYVVPIEYVNVAA